jgi:hypothetical protein
MQKVGPYKKVPSLPLKGKPVCLIMVPEEGVEPPWAEARGILRPPTGERTNPHQEPLCEVRRRGALLLLL